ncbi:MADF domain-containing protein [Aphelenchoides bicaudatus]|nr:MADF domain-containing protein [Aphelenchoides bicaudatus]
MTERPPTFNELLIYEVKQHPELYDQQHRVCTDSDERNCMWESIAQRIDENVTAGFAKKRWLQLRDRYRKELKTSLRSLTRPKWPYFEKLSWLDQYLKDSKSAGLNPLFLSKSFNNLDNTPISLDSLIKDGKLFVALKLYQNLLLDGNEIGDFTYSQTLNANTLLENIMAASSSAFEQLQRQRESGKFSPDSAVASNEDGETSHNNGLLNSSASTSGSEAGSSNGSDTETKLHQDSLSPERRSSAAQSDTTSWARWFRGLSAAAQQQKAAKQRNPPYLVRRGGGMRVKPENGVERPNVLSAFKPLAKTMSVGGLMSLSNSSTTSTRPNLHLTQSVGLERDNKSSFEYQAQELDEDMLFARLIVLKLKKLSSREKRTISSQIFDLLNAKEEQIEIN